MKPNLQRKLRTLAIICLFTSFAGVIFQLISEKLLNYKSVMVGFPLGLVFGIMELFLLPRAESKFRQWTFTRILLFKAFLYTSVIYLITIALAIIAGLIDGNSWSELPPMLISTDQLILVLYSLTIFSLLLFFLQVNHLLGEGILWKFILGKYHRPREEERIFMFLDMKSSTSIAEKLGHIRFYNLLNELFHDMSQPILQTKAEIYQYVGDEVVLTWEVDDGLSNSNCLHTFFKFRQRLYSNRVNYLRDFGVVPEFKAGLHFGKVVSAQIGDLKREIVYNGDVLNTTSRIQSECNKYDRDCLVSGALKDRLQHINGFQWERLDAVMLRGKETEVELFSVVEYGS